MAKSAHDRIVESRLKLIFYHPFYGILASRLKLVEASDIVPTAGVDGRNFFYNEEFIQKLNDEQLLFVTAHEVMHCVYDHMSRRGSRDPRLWNCAGDFVINYELVQAGIGSMPDEDWCKPLYDEKYANMTSYEIYDILKENDEFDGESFDIHFEIGEDEGSGGDGEGKSVSVTLPEGMSKGMSQEEKDALKEEIKKAVMDAAKAAGAGNVPCGVKRLLDTLTNPKMDWREMLRMHIQSMLKNDYTFSIPSRKNSALGGIYLPGMKPDNMVEAAIFIDTSGSISVDMLRDFISEIHGLMEQFTDFKLTIGCFDTSVHNVVEYDSDNLDSIEDYEPAGFGGTCFECFFDYMKQEDLQPEKLIVFTDGGVWGDNWGDPNWCDTIWVIHGGGYTSNITAPFGITVQYD